MDGELRGVPSCPRLLWGVLEGQESSFWQEQQQQQQDQQGAHSSCKSSICVVQESGLSPLLFCQSSFLPELFQLGAELVRARMRGTWASLAKPIFRGLEEAEGGGRLLRVVSQGVSGVRQCPGKDLILSLPLIYCARHAPHGPHRGSNFLSTSLIFRSTFCTMHCSLLR